MAAPEMCPLAGSIVSPGNQSSGGAPRVTRVRAECGNAGGKDARTAEPWAGSACGATRTLKREGCGFSPSVLAPPATDRRSAGWLQAQVTVRAVRGRPLPPSSPLAPSLKPTTSQLLDILADSRRGSEHALTMPLTMPTVPLEGSSRCRGGSLPSLVLAKHKR